jgi:hypothetical protein
MKKAIVITPVLILLKLCLFAQYNGNFAYLIKKVDVESGVIPLVYKDSNGKITSFKMCNEQLYAVITLEKNIPIIDFLPIPQKYNKDSIDCICNKELSKGGHFEIDLSKPRNGRITRYVELPFTEKSIGLGVTPFKYRYKADDSIPSTVTTNLGLHFNFGRTWGYSIIKNNTITNVAFTAAPFFGVTSVDLKKNSVKDPNNWNKDITNLAFSYGLNAIASRNKLGFSLSYGFDYNIGQFANSWLYQNKPWIGFGINTNLGNY